ncbi:uracil phosphoribosyltransferase-domain-containing protein [Xylariaceae sp. FL0255]|nr:uracil phosphoribosyltransferase-domain-containing protein [Xylariaceae sp. FL0255]
MLSKEDKEEKRRAAINAIQMECSKSGKLGIVNILYLDVPAEVIGQRRQEDTERVRPSVSVEHLRNWKYQEKTQLQGICQKHMKPFCALSAKETVVHKALMLLRDFKHHTEDYNSFRVTEKLDEIVGGQKTLQTMLVFDADKTLATKDTGELFWQTISEQERKTYHDSKKHHGSKNYDENKKSYLKDIFESPIDLPYTKAYCLKDIFGGPFGYSYAAFRQVALLYEMFDEDDFDNACNAVASSVDIHPEILSLMQRAAEEDHVGTMIVTCGLRSIWERVLERHGLSQVKVIGGSRIADGYVVTAKTKATIVSRLRELHHLYVVAFGDSPLDLAMLSAADEAIMVVGPEETRSKSMDEHLNRAISSDNFEAMQALLPRNAPPRLDSDRLPIVRIDEELFVVSVRGPRSRLHPSSRVLHTTDTNVSKLLMTPMRDANINGPQLREAHCRVGYFLATGLLAELLGLEKYKITHVQGHKTDGFRVKDEQRTSIIALMRGGEPMALGISDVLPEAMFVHAKAPEDVLDQHLDGQRVVILVDSVVNSGKTAAEFIQCIREKNSSVLIVVIAGVIQKRSVSEGSLMDELWRDDRLHLIALRISENKFTGKGTTDTGNRLFSTTRLL